MNKSNFAIAYRFLPSLRRIGTIGAMVGALAFFAQPAHGEVYCVGPVSESLVTEGGSVLIYSSWRNDWTTVCNLNSARGNVSPQVCFSWFSAIQTAVTQRRNLGLYYLTPTDQSFCNTMPTYDNAPTPYYVRTN